MNISNHMKYFEKWILILPLVLSSFVATGQKNLDSLWQVWNDKNQLDTIRLGALHDIAWNGFLYSNPDSAFQLAQLEYNYAKSRGLKRYMADARKVQGVSFWVKSDYEKAMNYNDQSFSLSKEIDYKKGIASALNIFGLIYDDQGDYTKALEYYSKSFDLFDEIGDKKGQANALNNSGPILRKQGKHLLAIDNYTQSLNLYEEIGDRSGVAMSLNNIAVIYDYQGNYKDAIDYYMRSLTIEEEIGKDHGVAISLSNVGNIFAKQEDYNAAIDYYNRSLAIRDKVGDKKGKASTLNSLGEVYMKKGNYDSALFYYNDAHTLSDEIGDKLGVFFSLNHIGDIYMEVDDSGYSMEGELKPDVKYSTALEYYFRGLALNKEIGHKQGIALSLNNIGNVYLKQKNYTQAIEYCNQALKVAQEVGDAVEIRDAANMLYDAYKSTNRPGESLNMYELYIMMHDSIESKANQREVLKQQFKYDYGKKAIKDSISFAKEQLVKDALIKLRDAELRRTRTQQYALIGGILLLAGFLLFGYNKYQITRRQQLIISQQNKELDEKKNEVISANDRLKRLIGYVSHDLRNAIGGINGVIGFIDEANGKNKKQIIELIKSSSENALEMIYTILESAALGTGKIDLKIDELNLSKLLNERIEYYKQLGYSNIQNWEQDIESDIIVQADKNRILQVIDNLLSNAYKYTPSEGHVTITGKCPNPSQMEVIIENSTDQKLRKAADKYDVRKRIGFGLEIVREILKLHNSKLKVQIEGDTHIASFLLKIKTN